MFQFIEYNEGESRLQEINTTDKGIQKYIQVHNFNNLDKFILYFNISGRFTEIM